MRAGLLLEGLSRSFTVKVLVVPIFGVPPPPTGRMSSLATDTLRLSLNPADDPVSELIGRLQLPGGRERAQVLHPLPSLSRRATGPAAAQALEQAAGVDLVLVLRTYLAPVLDGMLERAERPALLLDVDDVESVAQRELGRPDQAEAFERLESHYLPLVDRVIVCSNADARVLTERLPLPEPAVIPNAIRPPVRLPGPPSGDHDLLFVANLSYEPNIEAAAWLCGEVLRHLPDVRVALVGSQPAAAVRALADDRRVTLAADVEDVAPWYAGASVATVPVLRGGGSRIKLIEAFAHLRPVVATPTGARGAPWSQRESPVVLADTPARFAQACRELRDDPLRAGQLAARGAALVRERASVEIVAAQIDRLALSMVGM